MKKTLLFLILALSFCISNAFAQEKDTITVRPTASTCNFEGKAHTLSTEVTSITVTSGHLRSGDAIFSVTMDSSYFEVGSYDVKVKDIVIKDNHGVDVTDLYYVKKEPATLTINHREYKFHIEPQSLDVLSTYDGTLQQFDGWNKTSFTFDEVTFHMTDCNVHMEGTNAGVYPAVVTGTPKIWLDTMGHHFDVTEEFEIVPVVGNLTIGQKPLEIGIDSARDYNGDLFVVDYHAAVAELVPGDMFIAGEARTSSAVVGTYKLNESSCFITVDFETANGIGNYYVTKAVNLTIDPLRVHDTIKGETYDGAYDGTIHNVSGYTHNFSDPLYSDSYLSGPTPSSVTADRMVAGKTNMNLRPAQFVNNNDNFEVFFHIQDGYVQITPIGPIKITTDSETKIYDGDSLKKPTFTYTGTILPGDTLIASVTGGILNAGKTNNTLDDYQVIHVAGWVDVTSSYEFSTPSLGVLRVKPVDIYIKTNDSTKMYDGTPLVAPFFTITSGSYVGADTMIPDFSSTYITDPGMVVNDYIPVFSAGTVPENYQIHNDFGTLKVIDSLRVSARRYAIACHGGSTSINIYPKYGHEGVPPYQYQVNDGPWQAMSGSSQRVGHMYGGNTYTVRMKDALGVVDSVKYTPTDPEALKIDTIIVTNTDCGKNNGGAKAEISGGVKVDGRYYFYHWSTGAQTPTVSGLAQTTYSLTVSDKYGCEVTKDFTVDVGKTIKVKSMESEQTCRIEAIGFCVTPQDGTNGYIPAGTTYSWGAPTVIPASATPYVTNTTTGTDLATICTGNVKNTSGVPVTVRYKVIPQNPSCGIGDTFHIDIKLGGHEIAGDPITISPEKFVICSKFSGLDTFLTVNLTGLIQPSTETYYITWKMPGGDQYTQVHGGDVVATLPITVPDTCAATFGYRFEILDPQGCTHKLDGSYNVTPGSWHLPDNPDLVTVACAEDARAPHLGGGLLSMPTVETECYEPVPWTYSSYATGEHCDLYINHMYTYKDCRDSSGVYLVRFRVKDTVPPTTRADYPRTVKAPVYECVFTVPSLMDSITPIEDNCHSAIGGLFTINQNPAPGTIITEDTDVVIEVIDHCGNSAFDTIRVTVDDSIRLEAIAYDSHCYDLNDGYILGTFSGGVAPYDIIWKTENGNGAKQQDTTGYFRFDDLADGLYKITIHSGHGCVSADTVELLLEDYDEPLVVTARSGSRPYNGVAFELDTFDLSGTLRTVHGVQDSIAVEVEGSITNVGTVQNMIKDVVVWRGDTDVTCEYNLSKIHGSLVVSKRKVTLKSADASKAYDATPLTAHTVTIDPETSFATGEGIDHYDVYGTITMVGHVENDYDYYLTGATDPNNYEITKQYGTLTISKNTDPIVITALDSTRDYDCTPLTQPKYKYDGHLFAGDTLIATTSGVQTYVGVNYNVISSYKILNSSLVDVTSCYTIKPTRVGKLTVHPLPITITAGSTTVMYDGMLHTWEEIPLGSRYTLDALTPLASCDKIDTVPLTGGGVIPDAYITTVNKADMKIVDALTGVDRKSNYAITDINGHLTITDHIPPYPIKIVAHSDSVGYTGAPQTCKGFDTLVVNGIVYPWGGSTNLEFSLINEHGDVIDYRIEGVTASVTKTHAGNYPVEINHSHPVIYDSGNHDVTAQFDIDYVNGVFKIGQLGMITIHITDTKPYDAQPLTTAWNHTSTYVDGLGSADHLNAGTMVTNFPAIGAYTDTANVTTIPWKSHMGIPFNTTGGIDNYSGVAFVVNQTITTGITMNIGCPDVVDVVTKTYDGTPLQPEAQVNAAPVHDGSDTIFSYKTYDESTHTWSAYSNMVPSITHVAESPLKVRVKVENQNYYSDSCEYTLKINPRNVKFTTPTAYKEYYQTDWDSATVVLSGEGFVGAEGTETCTAIGHIKNVDTIINPLQYTLNTLTDARDYKFDTTIGKLGVYPRPVTIKSHDSTRVFTGLALTNDSAEVVSLKGFLGGDTVSYNFTGTQTIPGFSQNTFTVNGFTHGTDASSTIKNYKITLEYGTLKVKEEYVIEVTSRNDTFQYTGTAHKSNKFTVKLNGVPCAEVPSSGGLKYYVYSTDNILTITPTASITNVIQSGMQSTFTYAIQFGDQHIEDCYTVDKKDTGKLYVTPIPLQIVVNNTKEYNKSVLATSYNDGTHLTVTGLVSGDKLTAGVITTDEDSVHVYPYGATSDGLHSTITTDFVVKNSSNVQINENYIISYAGTQTITPSDDYTLTCPSGASITKTYDGDTLKPVAVVTGQYGGDAIKIEYSTDGGSNWSTTQPKIKHVDESIVNVQVRATHHDYVTKDCNYALTINKRNVKPTSPTDTKVYDHTPLTNDAVTTPTTGIYLPWVAGEEATYTVTGTQTEVGSSDNDFDFTWNAAANHGDYIVTLDTGTLTVTPSPNLKVYCPGTTENPVAINKTYDGSPLNPAADTAGLYGDDKALIEYSINGGTTWTTTPPGITHYVQGNAGSPYAVKVRATHADYQTATCDYNLTISKRPITITSADSTQVYDGTENRKEVTSVTAGSFVGSESFVYSAWTGITHFGTQSNTFNYGPGAGTDTADYQVTRVYGTLKITPSPLAVVTCPGGDTITKKYDGTPLKPTAFAKGIGTDIVPVQYSTSASGPWQNTPISITNVGTQHVYVQTNNPDYAVQTCDYILTDTCRHITLGSQDSTREYNGLPMEAHRITVGGDGFVAGETFNYNTFASITHVGSKVNTFNYTDGTASLANYCVDDTTCGVLTITRSTMNVYCPATAPNNVDTVKIYDFTQLNPSATVATSYASDASAVTIYYSTNGGSTWSTTPASITNKGTIDVEVMAVHSDYDTAYCNYHLRIKCRPLTLTSESKYKVYDATTWKNEVVTIGGMGLVGTHTINYSNFPSIKVVDTIPNTFDYEFATPTDADNYCITVVNGNIGVSPATMTLTCPSTVEAQKVYNGADLQPIADADSISGSGDVIKVEYSTDGGSNWSTTVPSIKDKGEQAVKVRASHHDYDTAYCDYTLKVTCRPITLTSGSEYRIYDATTWSHEHVAITDSGMVAGESITFDHYATIKDVDTVNNTFDYHFVSPADANNYCVTVVNGKLGVRKADITLTCPSTASDTEKVYDGTPLQPVATATGEGSDVITVEYSTNNGTTWSTTAPSITNVGTLSVMVKASNSNYNSDTCYYGLKITPYTTPVDVYVVGHTGIFNWDGNPHTVSGYDTSSTDALYSAVLDTSFTFTGIASVTHTDITPDSIPMGLLVSQYSNHNPNFTNVTFHVEDGWIKIKDIIKPYFVFGCSEIGDTVTDPNYTGNKYLYHGTRWNAQADDNIGIDSLYYLLSGATTFTTPVSAINSIDGQIFNYGVTLVTWVAKDAAGNDTTCTFTVTVNDAEPPTVTCPGDTMVMCSGADAPSASTLLEFFAIGGMATDNVSLDTLSFKMIESTDHHSCPETITRKYSIKDNVGNEGFCIQTIIVKDTVKPTFTVPADLIICRDDDGKIVAPISVTGIMHDTLDNCTPIPNLIVVWHDRDTLFTDDTVRVIRRDWSLTDQCGNTTTKTQHISIKPSIMTPGNFDPICPSDTTVVMAYGDCDTAVLLPSPAYVNHMKGTSVVVGPDHPDGYRYGVGTTLVTWTFEDECGAKKFCYQNVTVEYPPCGGVLDSVEDFDHYRYSSVRVGCYCWTGENLRSVHYSNGDTIPSFGYYQDDPELEKKYGKLYSWYSAVKVPEGNDDTLPVPNAKGYVQGICPPGWAVPSVEDYERLVADAGGVDYLKDTDPEYWLPGQAGKEPNTGFKMRGAGLLTPDITYPYQDLLAEAFFWTVDAFSSGSSAYCAWFSYFCDHVEIRGLNKGLGFSMRCIKRETIVNP